VPDVLQGNIWHSSGVGGCPIEIAESCSLKYTRVETEISDTG